MKRDATMRALHKYMHPYHYESSLQFKREISHVKLHFWIGGNVMYTVILVSKDVRYINDEIRKTFLVFS